MVGHVLPTLNSLQALVNTCAYAQMDLMENFARKILTTANPTPVAVERVWTVWIATSVNAPLVWEVTPHCFHL